ncbi:MAG TPA: pyridoxamine 5'-phosphate oxidase family protein [Arenimonas sp.]|nr:pyridoxamine 5'-phosphate oxidase family protein [Arenimonas sp.]
MQSTFQYSSDIAFTETVKAIQTEKGSRRAYANMERNGGWNTEISDDLQSFIEAQISVFLATANNDGQPYIQHRGGPPGFLRVLDEKTIGFVDFNGNRQFISSGNLSDNPKFHLFLIDYVNRKRVKIWGEAQVVEGDEALIAKLMPSDYKARAEQVILLKISAWDANCPQHIPIRYEAADVLAALELRNKRIAELESELALLQSNLTDR